MNLITYDMSGTSTDVALIKAAEPSVSHEIEIEYAMPIHVPMIDVRTVGAGGGSISRVTAAGLLAVGPESAGAMPGPICYGRGGVEPTISDANLLLGRLHACAIAREFGVPVVLVPARPGITNVLGFVIADLRHDFVKTLNRPLAGLDIAAVHAAFAAQTAAGAALTAAENVSVRGGVGSVRLIGCLSARRICCAWRCRMPCLRLQGYRRCSRRRIRRASRWSCAKSGPI